MSELKPCPFCGSEAAEPIFIGNDHARRRKVTIRCKAPGCTQGITVGAVKFSHEWCHQEAVKAWNTRATDTELGTAKARIAELEKGLEPFADTFNRHDGMLPLGVELVAISIGDLRRAAALRNKQDEGSPREE